MGYSNAKVNEAKVDVGYSSPGKTKITFAVVAASRHASVCKTLGAIVSQPEFDLHIFLNLGRHDCVLYTSDLTEEYVEFNKGNLKRSKSLGGRFNHAEDHHQSRNLARSAALHSAFSQPDLRREVWRQLQWIRPIRPSGNRVAREIVFLESVGINPVVVARRREAVTRAVEAAGLKTKFLQGQRVNRRSYRQNRGRTFSRARSTGHRRRHRGTRRQSAGIRRLGNFPMPEAFA